jgi:AraC-like DNA-binding protein
MGVLFRAVDEPAVSRLDYLRHVMSDTLVPLDIRPTVQPAELVDTSLTCDAGAVQVSAMTLSPGTAARTPKLIRRSDPEVCKIDVLTSGRMKVEQDGRGTELGPGDMAFVDLSRPCRWESLSPVQGVAVMFPRTLLPLRTDELARLTGTTVSASQGAGALASSFARQLPDHLDGSAAAERARLGTTVLDLMAIALAGRLGRRSAGSPSPDDVSSPAMLLRVHAYIETNLGDPELAPATIAAALHISVRYLHKLFEAEQTTVAGWIRQRRLDRCRRDLLDPALRSRPISAIATRWGFANPAHFSRVFRSEFDVPPGEYRLAAS